MTKTPARDVKHVTVASGMTHGQILMPRIFSHVNDVRVKFVKISLWRAKNTNIDENECVGNFVKTTDPDPEIDDPVSETDKNFSRQITVTLLQIDVRTLSDCSGSMSEPCQTAPDHCQNTLRTLSEGSGGLKTLARPPGVYYINGFFFCPQKQRFLMLERPP